MEDFKSIGLSHINAPIEVREAVAFERSEAGNFLMNMKDVFSLEEALLISTCNRTEIYYCSKEDIEVDLIRLVTAFKRKSMITFQKHFQSYNTTLATRHLFEVALGLQSQILGDLQISGQVKRAYQLSVDLNLAGPYLHRMMHTIFYANKRMIQETELQNGTVSIASVAVDLIDEFVSKIIDPRIALVGLGEIGQNVLENLGESEATITLVNRDRSKAEKLAGNGNVVVRNFDDLDQVIADNDVIVSSIPSKNMLLSADNFKSEAIYKLLIDLSVPRSMDASLDQLPGISLYNVDQLTERTLKARKIREKSIPSVKRIIDEALSGLENWKSEMEVSPTIQRLKKVLDQIRKEELARHPKLNDQEKELLEVVTKNMIQKVIKLPVLQLKAACKRGEAETLAGILNDLFNLDQQKVEKK